jgi:putative transposase
MSKSIPNVNWAHQLESAIRQFVKENKEIALEMFQQLESKWSRKYPREVQSWANELDVLLTFMDYPSSIRSVIYTTNAIERTIKEIRKRLKPMNSLSSLEATEKVVYLTIQDFNEK